MKRLTTNLLLLRLAKIQILLLFAACLLNGFGIPKSPMEGLATVENQLEKAAYLSQCEERDGLWPSRITLAEANSSCGTDGCLSF
jgi:hypothetical protein